ncbi:MAG TPA: hypothetical protein VGM62_00515 [Chthoniobacterales bacterium]|jgi:hypothetical protein
MKTDLSRFSVLIGVLLLCGCGSTTQTTMIGQARAAITPDAVRIYDRAPRHFERIAIINSSSGPSWGFTSREQEDEAIAKLKEEAAKLGANGILLEWIGTSSSGSLGIGVGGFGVGGGYHSGYAVSGETGYGAPIVHKSAQATAIYVRR